ncbi:MAG: PEGA domain-containing protein [Burkholderiales bacterium]|nr:PEGA domain-containing protein [Burkholderiales bacterium]
MDFTIFDTGDPRSPGSGEPKTTDKASEKAAAAGAASHAQKNVAGHGDLKRSDPPTRPGLNEATKPRFPRGYLLTVCTLIIENDDIESSRILANLFRALYQDQTAFNFSALNQLGALNREHAEKLIAAKLAGAYTPVEWERAFRLIEEYADPYLPAAPANPEVSEETGYLDDALAGLREQYLAPSPEAPPKPLPQPQQQPERSPSSQSIERERAQPRQPFEKPAAAPTAPAVTPAVKAEPQRTQPAPAERIRSIQQTRLTEPTRPPERTPPTEPSRQQTPRKSQPPIQRAEPRQHFARTDPPIGFVRTEPPPQVSARHDRGERDKRDDAGPVNFIVPPDSFRQPGNADFDALRREPIINLDVPLQPDRESNGEPERGGHDKLMYGLLALIIIAALAFVAINYSLFYKGGIPGLSKSAEVSRLPDLQARKVLASAATLSGPIDLIPVSQKTAIAPPRGMAFPAPRKTEQGPSESSTTPADADGLAAVQARAARATSPALSMAMDKSSASALTSNGAVATASESATLRSRVEASKPPAVAKESPSRANATRAASAASGTRKVALSDRYASRKTAVEADGPKSPAYLTFAVSPWGEVYVNGRRHGASPPLQRLELEPGKHTVEIRNGDLTPYRTVVELEPQTTVNIRQQFR